MKRLDEKLRRALETGRDVLGHFSPGLSDEELIERLRPLWRRFGKSVTRDFVRRHPGRRPACWWKFSAPAARLIAGPPDQNSVHMRTWEERDLFQGLLDESFLIKHGLLSTVERKVLDAQTAEYRRQSIPDADSGKVN